MQIKRYAGFSRIPLHPLLVEVSTAIGNIHGAAHGFSRGEKDGARLASSRLASSMPRSWKASGVDATW